MATSPKWDNNSLTFEPTKKVMDQLTRAESQITKAEYNLIAEDSKEHT